MTRDNGVLINDDTNTKIIVDNCFNWAISEDQAFLYMEAQLTVATRCRLSFSLPKSLFFSDRVEFVGIDIGIKFNMPATSKFELLCAWPKAVDVRAVASFILFGMWYQKWISYFEIKIQLLREITNTHECDNNITPELWTKDAKGVWNFVIQAIVSNPSHARWDSRYRFYIQMASATRARVMSAYSPFVILCPCRLCAGRWKVASASSSRTHPPAATPTTCLD